MVHISFKQKKYFSFPLTNLNYCFRPLNDDEQRINVPTAITCNEGKREVSVVQNIANKQVDKIFTFDKVQFPCFYSSSLVIKLMVGMLYISELQLA